jgi:hypothetical protein
MERGWFPSSFIGKWYYGHAMSNEGGRCIDVYMDHYGMTKLV